MLFRKRKTTRKLESDVRILENRVELHRKEVEIEQGRIQSLISNVRLRRLVFGRKGSGKTSFIQNIILPDLNDYLVVCLEHEYTDLDSMKLPSPVLRLKNGSATEIEDAIKIIGMNLHRPIIIDCIELFASIKHLRTLWDAIKDGQYIIACSHDSHTVIDFTYSVVYNFGGYRPLKKKGAYDETMVKNDEPDLAVIHPGEIARLMVGFSYVRPEKYVSPEEMARRKKQHSEKNYETKRYGHQDA